MSIKKENNKKSAMTLVALVVTLGVVSILLGMFIPVLTQGLVNITTGKAVDGKVNLSRQGGYFMCYYNEAGVLTQTRVDIQPNGHATLQSSPAAAAGCSFDIPNNAEEFRFTLIGGGGGGATPTFNIVDTDLHSDEHLIFEMVGGGYEFTSPTDPAEQWKLDAWRSFWLTTGNHTCVLGCRIFNNFAIETDIGERAFYKIVLTPGRFMFVKILNGVNNTTEVGAYCSPAAGIEEKNASCTSGWFSIAGVRINPGETFELTQKQNIFRVGVANGGSAGTKLTQTVSFLQPTTVGTNTFIIPPESIGRGGDVGNDGGDTTLFLKTDTGDDVPDIVARGGRAGTISERDVSLERGAISETLYAGRNGELDNFVPVNFQLIRLAQGEGANRTGITPVKATYPGSGGGGGAISHGAYNSCLEARTGFIVDGLYNDVAACPIDRASVTHEIGAGGTGADGAILIAW